MDKERITITQKQLTGSACRGDTNSFGKLYEHYYATMVWLAYSIVLDYDLSKDINQQSFVAACENLEMLREKNRALKSHDQNSETEKQTQFWRIIMKRNARKLAAAVVIIIAAGLFLYTINYMIPSPHALQDTIKAYNSITSLHIKVSETIGQETRASQAWLECDTYGNINRIRFHCPYCGEPVGSLTIAGSYDQAQAWLARHNLHLVGYGNPRGVMGLDISQINPRGLIERLYQQKELGEIILDVNEPTQKNKPILVTVTYPQGSLSENWKKILYIDQATKLVKKIEKFELVNGQYQHSKTAEFFDYNQQIDPEMFSLDGELPQDAMVVDVSGLDIGLEQGDMTDEEIAAEVSRQFFEAVIAKDFSKAGQLYLGAPGSFVEQAFMGLNLLKITSIETAQPETDPDSTAFVCSCKVLSDFHGQDYELDASYIKVMRTSEDSDRWVIAGMVLSVNPPSGGLAWADIIKPIFTAKTARFDLAVRDEEGDVTVITDTIKGSRINRKVHGVEHPRTIIDFETSQIITFDYTNKTVTYYDLEILPSISNYLKRLQNLITRLEQSPHFEVQQLDKVLIDGREGFGFRATSGDIQLTIWADIETAIPLLIEQKEPNIHVICKNLEFDPELDDTYFSTDVPEGYTIQKGQIDIKGTDEDFIAGLKMLAEISDNKIFPQDVSIEYVAKNAPNIGQQIDKAATDDEQAVEMGLKLSKMTAFIRFFHNHGQGQWYYAGDGVKLGDASKAVFWYQPKDSPTWRVIYGDLSVKDVSEEDLPK